MENCIFCKIIQKDVPAQIVYEDEMVVAFQDINPVAPVHILVVPRKHIPTFNDIQPEDRELVGHMAWVVKEVAKKHRISEKGYRVIANCGEDAGQVVYHLHYHLLGGRSFGHSLVGKGLLIWGDSRPTI